QPQHKHQVVPEQPGRRPARLSPGAVLRARRPQRSGGARRRFPRRKAMRPLRSGAAALAFLLAALRPAAADERILGFISDVAVERNADLQPPETPPLRPHPPPTRPPTPP